MHQAVAEVGLVAELVELKPHQLAPRQDQQRCGHSGVTKQAEREHLADAPQNQDVQREGEQGIEDADREAQALGGEGTGVLGDPLVRVVNVGGELVVGIENVISPVAHVIANQRLREPVAPDDAELVGEKDLRHADRQGHHKAGGIDDQDSVEVRLLLFHQGVGEIAGDESDASVDAIDGQQHHNDHRQQQPVQPAALTQLLAERHKAGGPQDE